MYSKDPSNGELRLARQSLLPVYRVLPGTPAVATARLLAGKARLCLSVHAGGIQLGQIAQST